MVGIRSSSRWMIVFCALLFPACGLREAAHREIVELTSEEAARNAAEIRSEVSVGTAEGLELTLWAPDALVAGAVALDVDPRGRVFLTRTVRRKTSDLDIREHRRWMADDLKLETVEERRDFLRRELAPERSASNTWLEDLNRDGSHDWRDLTVQEETVYRRQHGNRASVRRACTACGVWARRPASGGAPPSL